MATLKVPAGCRQLQELDSVQDTLADILSQLQDIDPSRLSLSPFLDLDTQISLAPVSDSPESSVEELRSTSEEDEEASPSLGASFEARAEGQAPGAESPVVQEPGPVVGLDPPGPAPEQSRGAASGDAVIVVLPRETSFLDSVGAAPCWEQPPAPSEELAKVPQCPSAPCPLPRDDQPPPSLCTPSPEEPAPSPPRGRGCSPQCSSAHLKAVSSAFVSLLLAPWILYGLHHLLPFEPPLCPDLASRLAFALRCLLIASVPVVLGKSGAVGPGRRGRLSQPCPQHPLLHGQVARDPGLPRGLGADPSSRAAGWVSPWLRGWEEGSPSVTAATSYAGGWGGPAALCPPGRGAAPLWLGWGAPSQSCRLWPWY